MKEVVTVNKQQYEKKLRTLNKRFEWFEKRFEKDLREYEENRKREEHLKI